MYTATGRWLKYVFLSVILTAQELSRNKYRVHKTEETYLLVPKTPKFKVDRYYKVHFVHKVHLPDNGNRGTE